MNELLKLEGLTDTIDVLQVDAAGFDDSAIYASDIEKVSGICREF